MTREEAALILDPETSRDALLPYESQEERIAVCEYACRLGAAALREQEERRWIPVTERFPEFGRRVIACGKNGGVFVVKSEGITTGFGRMDGTSKYRSFTHWIPLPQPPKGE